MLIPILAAVLTLLTFLLVAIWRGVLAIRRRPAARFWRHALAWHAGLFALHVFATVPLGLGVLATRFVGTRGDEVAYSGPRIGADGTWHIQTRETLAAEAAAREAAVEQSASSGAPALSASALTAGDGVELRAFLVPPRPERLDPEGRPRFAAVLVHGLFRGALEIETPGAMLRELGGEVLLLELRNHGGSERATATFGRDESLDVLAAFEFVRGQPELRDLPFVLYGVSLGTAAAALAAPRIPDLAALILDAPMDDLTATTWRMLDATPEAVPVLSRFWRGTIVWSAAHLGGIPFDEVVPRAALQQLPPDLPVFLIGAGRDDRMPPESVRALFSALRTEPDRKRLWIEEDASHGKVWVTAPDEYPRRLGEFLGAALGDPGPASSSEPLSSPSVESRIRE